MAMCGMFTTTIGHGHLQVSHGGVAPTTLGITTTGHIAHVGTILGDGTILGGAIPIGVGDVPYIGVGAVRHSILIT